jgi:ribosome-binding protein aMBF1 (putative translation factor)
MKFNGKEHTKIKSWSTIKDEVYGKQGTERRDNLDREVEAIKIGMIIREARLSKRMTQDELASLVSKKRSFIARIEKDGSNMNLRTLYEIVEKGLGGRVNIAIEV